MASHGRRQARKAPRCPPSLQASTRPLRRLSMATATFGWPFVARMAQYGADV